MSRSTAMRVLCWTVPVLFTLFIYWDALNAWFLQDDFVWLSQLREVHSASDLPRIIFRPTVQGTLRPWSDRVFFLLFQRLFGLDAFPYHACVFLTQFVNFALLATVMRRLTKSASAAFLAPTLWTGNAVLVMTMAWACLYKDILCSFFLLLAFYFFLRHVETGARRYYVWQWLVFLLGFGAMETNAMYPAIALSFALLCAPAHVRKTALLLIPSAIYLGWNFLFVKKQAAGPYAMHFDSFLPVNLLQYWILVLKPSARLLTSPWDAFVLPAITTVALLGYIVWQWRAGRRLPVFFLMWFLLTLLPVLPLREQFQTYYVTVPSLGLAMLGADAISIAWGTRTRFRWVWRTVAAVLGLAFLIPSADLARSEAGLWRTRGNRAEQFLMGVAAARELHPDDTLVVDGVDTSLFWDVIPDGGFRAAEVFNVYLAPGSDAKIRRRPYSPDPADYVIATKALQADADRSRVYYAGNGKLHDITRTYLEHLLTTDSSDMPRHVEVATPSMASFLSGGWYAPDEAHRWMGKQAGIRLAGPKTAGESLHIVGVCPPEFLADGPVILTVSVNGDPMPPLDLKKAAIDASFPLPQKLVGSGSIDVTLGVNRTHRPPQDARELGVAIRLVEIR